MTPRLPTLIMHAAHVNRICASVSQSTNSTIASGQLRLASIAIDDYGSIGTGPLSLVLPPNLKELVKANVNTIVNISDLSETSKTLIERIRLYPAINNI